MIDNKTKKNANDILVLENKLEKEKITINTIEIGISIYRGFSFIFNKVI